MFIGINRVLGAGSPGSNGSPLGNTKEVTTHTHTHKRSVDAQTHAFQLPLLKLLEVALQDIIDLNSCLDYCGNSHLQYCGSSSLVGPVLIGGVLGSVSTGWRVVKEEWEAGPEIV